MNPLSLAPGQVLVPCVAADARGLTADFAGAASPWSVRGCLAFVIGRRGSEPSL